MLVVWGVADGVVDTDYGRAYADAIPGARFVLDERAGHMAQMEDPDALLAQVDELVARTTPTAAR